MTKITRTRVDAVYLKWTTRYATRWERCSRCELSGSTRTRPIMRGRIPFKVLFVGEAPGESEDVLGVPFAGPAGKLLDFIITRSLDDTRVVNVRNEAPDVMIDRSTKWGNPFKIGDPNVASLDGEPMTREQVISLYESWITGRRDMMDSLKELRGKVLGCHCKPLPCHGDVLCRLMIDRFGTRIPYLIANCVVCTPPRINGKIREPTKAEKVECEAHLRELIGKHNPLLIVALGEHAHRSLTRVEHLHLIHPAALLRYPERRMDIAVQECINTLRREVGARGL